MSYVNVFGGNTIYPSDVSYLALTLAADVTLSWPLDGASGSVVARILDVTASTTGVDVTLPDATLTSAGQTVLFNNVGVHSFNVRDYAGNLLAVVAPGEQWQLYLTSTASAAGTWRVFQFGASTATVQASALAGYGIVALDTTLSQSVPVTTFNVSRSMRATDRASALVWTGTGAGSVTLPTAASVGNNFSASVRNSGGGSLTLNTSETIDGASSIVLQPGESATLVTNGVVWYSIGRGQESTFAFDYTSISVASAPATYTLSGSELNRIAYRFTGALTNDVTIIVPSTTQQYWVDNSTTGPFALKLSTLGGTAVTVPQGARGIYYCKGANIVNAATASLSTPVGAADGGTGQTTYTTGDLLYASGATTLSKLPDVAVGNVLCSGGVGVAPNYGKVDLATAVTGVLPVANGGGAGGAYTPGLSNTTNVSASASPGFQYLRVGNTVTVSGQLDVTPTAAGNFVIGLGLPIASTLGLATRCAGTAVCTSATVANNTFAQVFGDTTNNRATLRGNAPNTTSMSFSVHFTYQVV